MNILYVCTGNIFRSMSAEYLSKKYINDCNIKNISVSSAGTRANPESPFPETLERLSFYGCDASSHKQRKINIEILKDQDFIICMTEYHKKIVLDLGFQAMLFNEIAYGKTEDLLDDAEYAQIHGNNFDYEKYFVTIVDYIHDAIPFVIKHVLNK